MTDLLPTFDRGFQLPAGSSAPDVASEWFGRFASAVERTNTTDIVALCLSDAYWRDVLSLTWDYRVIHGADGIQQLLDARLSLSKLSDLRLDPAIPPTLATPYPDLAWVQAGFEFETSIGKCKGVFRLVCRGTAEWKAFTMFTNLEELKGFKESINFPLGPISDGPQDFLFKCPGEQALADDIDPVVVVVGAGQAGLSVAARLKGLSVPTMVVERHARIGDQWRERYATLYINDPIWRNHLPYLPFPDSLGVYLSGAQVGDWLEYYAQCLELDVLTASTLTAPVWDASQKRWTAVVVDKDGSERTLKPRHIIWAANVRAGAPNIPRIAGMEDFGGTIMHSSEHRTARDYTGKKVIVIGAAMSGHDIAGDCLHHGADVTMYQRGSTYIDVKKNKELRYKPLYWKGGPPTDVAHRLSNSLPVAVAKLMAIRGVQKTAELEKETLEGLRRVGFKLNSGMDGAGSFYQAMTRGGGHYSDNGVCDLIIHGRIKLKNDAGIKQFTADGVEFTDGSHLPADLVVFATGFFECKSELNDVFGDETTSSLKDAWQLDEEGEFAGIWRGSGHEGLWFATGNFPQSHFNSRALAFQIKAIEEGIFGTRYSI